MDKQKTKESKKILNNKRTSDNILIPDFKLYRGIVTKHTWFGMNTDMFINSIESKCRNNATHIGTYDSW